jgi:hypothetical protein
MNDADALGGYMGCAHRMLRRDAPQFAPQCRQMNDQMPIVEVQPSGQGVDAIIAGHCTSDNTA